MLTVLGFLVGIGLSLRNTTAYERYSEGRRYWSSMHLQVTNLARLVWINGKERDGELGKEDLLAKMYVGNNCVLLVYANCNRTAINLLVAFSKAVMHRLRFEPYMDYDDMRGYVDYLNTYSREANIGVNTRAPKHGAVKRLGEILGITFCEENPRKLLKKSEKPTGNLPLEILGYLQAYFDSAFENKLLTMAVYQQQSSKLNNSVT
jgi:putative membrane protein